MKTWQRVLLILVAVGSVAVLAIIADVQLTNTDWIFSPGTPHPTDESLTAIVLGAGLRPDGQPSDALHDRLEEGIQLLHDHAVGKILLTGDDGKFHNDEIDAMKNYLFSKGVSSTDLLIDGKGYRTYESCKHAAEMGIKRAIVVTQRFHLGRALYLCNNLGVESIGEASDFQPYRGITFFWARDLLSSVEAWWDINVRAPKPPV